MIKIIRVLWPLRFLTHFETLKVIMISLIKSTSGLFNVIIVIFIIWLMFAILGVSLLKGKMGYCVFNDNRSYYNINIS